MLPGSQVVNEPNTINISLLACEGILLQEICVVLLEYTRDVHWQLHQFLLSNMCVYLAVCLDINFNARLAISMEFCNDGSPRQALLKRLPTAVT